MSTDAVHLQHKNAYVQGVYTEKAPPKKKALIGNRVKDLCVNFFASKKERKSVGKVAGKNAQDLTPSHKGTFRSVEAKPLLARSNYGSLRPIYPPAKIVSTSDFVRRSDEYLLSKYDIARLHKGVELIKWQSIKLASSKNDSARYKAYVEKLHPRRLSENIRESIRNASETVLSIDEKYGFLNKDELYSVRQLKHIANVDLQSGLGHLRHLDDLLRRVPVLMPQNLAIITSHFGKRKLPYRRKPSDHKGIDMTSPEAVVYAAADGRVEFCGWCSGFGNLLVINHGKFTTKYAHLRKMCVTQGKFVTQGSKIAFEGATGGGAKGRHLHFEVRSFVGEALDPMGFINCSMQESQKLQSDKVLALQKSRYNKSVMSSLVYEVKPLKGSYSSKNLSKSPKNRAHRDIVLAQNDSQRLLIRKKVAAKALSSKHLPRSTKSAEIQADDLQNIKANPEEKKKSFFGKIYHAIVPWQ